MNAYTFEIFILHSIVLESIEEDGIYTTTCELVEIGPLNGPDKNNIESIKAMIRDISSTPVIQKWWTDFSTWEDFYGILRVGTELTMHSIVTKINNQLALLENSVSYIDLIDDNGNITIHLKLASCMEPFKSSWTKYCTNLKHFFANVTNICG